ncbi:transmembrane protein, putative (macronuclear) [Tetrahymena thermophila SB210]|uniref:Transmembrane protein, putative n=1 Tax=Tetrahymena thermophila (strain SB210) TaxID=312017 RepID=I7M8G5_TETTS|nr:transmembrane protein, putative [Tetrahymena thermophila SB210]EAR98133.2 transmembrane protein, putative [Tetrahymena thermophila SB210]|eukprot:XP_001018378.2 transmembrane protein, putative [Tetrahymena thermophila SB210]
MLVIQELRDSYQTNSIVSLFSSIRASYIFVSHIIIAVFQFKNQPISEEFFYFFTLCTAVLVYLLLQIQNLKRNQIQVLDQSNQIRSVDGIDTLLEEIMKTYKNSYQSCYDNLRFHYLVSYHKRSCILPTCVCQSQNLNYSKNQIELKFVNELIENIFSYVIQLSSFSATRSVREKIFLKYITFIAFSLNNPLKSYFELRMFNKKYHELNSFQFNAISNILAKKFENMIHQTQKQLYLSKLNQDLDNNLVFSIQEIVDTDKIEKIFVDLTSNFLKQKILFYTLIKKEKLSFQKIKTYSQNLLASYEILRKNLFLKLKKIKNKKEFQRNYILQKILQIYWIVVFGGIKKPLKLQKEMNLIFNLNQERAQKEFNSLNLIKGNIQIVQASITQGYGKIMNKQETQLSKFFGFNFEEFKSINHIKELMPSYVAKIHDEIVKDFIKRGHSILLEESHQVFCLDKQGFFVPITLQLSLVYGITDDLQMNAVLLKLKSDVSYITFNQVGQIKGFDRNFFSHLMQLENADQKIDQMNLLLKKDLEKINLFFLIPQMASIVLEYLTKINKQNKITEENQNKESNILKRQIYKDVELKICLPADIFSLIQAFQIQYDINQDTSTKSVEYSTINNYFQQYDSQIQMLNNFTSFYLRNQEKWEQNNCFSQFNSAGNIKVNMIKKNNLDKSDLQNKFEEEMIFELSFSDTYLENLCEKTEKYEKLSKELQNSQNDNLKNRDNFNYKEVQLQQDQSQYHAYLDQISPQRNNDQKQKNDQNTNSGSLQSYNNNSNQESQNYNNIEKHKNTVKRVKEVNFNFEESENIKQIAKLEDNLISPRLSTRQQFSIDKLETTINVLSSNRIYQNSQQLLSSPMNNSFVGQIVQEKQNHEEIYAAKLSNRRNQDKTQLETVNAQTQSQNNRVRGSLAKVLKKKIESQNYQLLEKQQKKQISQINSSNKSQISSYEVVDNEVYDSQDTSSYLDILKENNLINNIIHRQKENMSSSLLKIILGYTVIFSTILSTIFLFFIYNKQNQLQDYLNKSTVYSSFFSQVSQISLTQLLKYEINLGVQPNLKLEQIYQIGQRDQFDLIQQYLKSVEKIVELESNQQIVDTQVYSISKGKEFQLSSFSFYYEYSNAMFYVVQQEKQQRYQDMSYFLFSNILQSQTISTTLIQNNISDLNIIIKQINYAFLFAIFIAIGIQILLIVFIIPKINKINKFQEVILTVFSRVTFEEVELQLSRYQCYLDRVQNTAKNWIQFDFLSVQTLNAVELAKLSQKGQFNDIRESKNIQSSVNQLEDRKGVYQKQISTKLNKTQLNILKYIILLAVFSLSSITFMAVGLGISYSNQTDIKNRLDLYQYNQNAIQSFRSILSLSEIALRINAIRQTDVNFPDNNLQEIRNIFSLNLNVIKTYIIEMNHYVSNLSNLDNNEEKQIETILQQNLCNIYKDEIQCSDTSSTQNIFQQGFFSVLSLYTSFFQQYSELLKESSLTKQQLIALAQQYSSTDEYINLIPQGFNIPNRNFENLFQTIQLLFQNKLNYQKIFLLCYILVGGFIMYLIWLLFSTKLKMIFDKDINAVKFLLTCMPHEKQQDDHINQLLKIVNKK